MFGIEEIYSFLGIWRGDKLAFLFSTLRGRPLSLSSTNPVVPHVKPSLEDVTEDEDDDQDEEPP